MEECDRFRAALQLQAREGDGPFFDARRFAQRILAGWPVDLAAVPQYDRAVRYVVISELPRKRQGQFRAWLVGRTIPHVNGISLECAFAHDFERWVESLLAAD